MEPDYAAGDLVLIDPNAPLVAGQVVVARHPFKNVDIIKYLAGVDPDGYARLESPSGDDSRQFGRVPVHTVKGTVTWNWKAKRT